MKTGDSLTRKKVQCCAKRRLHIIRACRALDLQLQEVALSFGAALPPARSTLSPLTRRPVNSLGRKVNWFVNGYIMTYTMVVIWVILQVESAHLIFWMDARLNVEGEERFVKRSCGFLTFLYQSKVPCLGSLINAGQLGSFPGFVCVAHGFSSGERCGASRQLYQRICAYGSRGAGGSCGKAEQVLPCSLMRDTFP